MISHEPFSVKAKSLVWWEQQPLSSEWFSVPPAGRRASVTVDVKPSYTSATTNRCSSISLQASPRSERESLQPTQNEILNPICPSRPGSTCVIDPNGWVEMFSRFWTEAGF